MKRNSKRRHPFVLVKMDYDREVFISLLQSPKVPERFAWKWVIKKVRNWFRKQNIPFSEWCNYLLYPVNRFNCSQFDCDEEEIFYEHIHIADSNEDDDKDTVEFYNGGQKSKYNCKIK